MENDMKINVKRDWRHCYMNMYICENCPLVDILNLPLTDIHWFYLCKNTHPCIVDFLKLHRSKVHWRSLARNSSDAVVDFLLEEAKNGWEIEWDAASENTNEKIIACFKNVKSELNPNALSLNPATSSVQFLLSEMYEKINWVIFCRNPNDLALDVIIDILGNDMNDKRIIWDHLCDNTNPRIFPILQANQQKIKWDVFIKNPICFAYNYEKIKERCAPLKQELLDIFLHPNNVMARIEMEKNVEETDFDVISRIDFN